MESSQKTKEGTCPKFSPRPGRLRNVKICRCAAVLGAPPGEPHARERQRAGSASLPREAAAPRLPTHADHAAFVRRLCAVNPRLTPARADFLARHVGCAGADGRVEMACDPWHKVPSPFMYRIEDVMACWRQVSAPTLLLLAEHGYVTERFGDDPAELQRRLDCFADRRVLTIADAGHNLQHDQPAQVAAALEAFLDAEAT